MVAEWSDPSKSGLKFLIQALRMPPIWLLVVFVAFALTSACSPPSREEVELAILSLPL